MDQAVDYPILVYNSFYPLNNELVITNMAEREKNGVKRSHVVRLGKHYRFLKFVSTPFMNEIFNYLNRDDSVKKTHCLIFFLVWNT